MNPYLPPNHRRDKHLLTAAAALAMLFLDSTACGREPESAVTEAAETLPQTRVPLFEGMGPHQRKVTTRSAEAQRYFDQGLNWAYAFNHDEAIRSFEEAARLDPDCAMAHWGKALCHGPHINNPVMDEAGSIAAWSALGKALALADRASPAERALIHALEARYKDPATGALPLTVDERKPFDEAYAKAMESVHAEFREDADIATLYAESLMDLHPWDLYEVGTHAPKPWTARIVEVIEHAISQFGNDCLKNPPWIRPDIRTPGFSATVLILWKHAKLALTLARHRAVPWNPARITHRSHWLLLRLTLGASGRTKAENDGGKQKAEITAHKLNIKQAPRHASLRSL